MAGNNSLQFLRGPASNIASSTDIALAGQPVYDTTDNYLYVGDGTNAIKTLKPIKSSYANNAGIAGVANKLSTSGGTSSLPIYFSDGKPVQCCTTLNVNITGNANVATYAVRDSSGNNIINTYAKKGEIGTGKITVYQNNYSKGSFNLNQQSNSEIRLNDTTYSAGSGLSLANTTFSVNKAQLVAPLGTTSKPVTSANQAGMIAISLNGGNCFIWTNLS